MAKLDFSQITDQEAAQYRIAQLSSLKLGNEEKDMRVSILTTDEEGNPKTVSYMLSEAVEHIRAFLEGKPDPIGAHEVKFAKRCLAYERGGRK